MPYSDPVRQRQAKAESARRARAAAMAANEEGTMAEPIDDLEQAVRIYGDDVDDPADDLDDEDAPPPRWDGTTTVVRLARPILRDHRVIHEGSIVELDASEVPGRAGRFVGPEGEHLETLIRSGLVEGTAAARQRSSRQALLDAERGVAEGARSLRAMTGRRLERQLAAHGHSGDPVEELRKERMAARASDSADAGPQHAGVRRHRITSPATATSEG